MDHTEELASISGELEDIARALKLIALDVQEQRHARQVRERDEHERLQGYADDAIDRANDAAGKEGEQWLWDQARGIQRDLALYVEMYPHLKED